MSGIQHIDDGNYKEFLEKKDGRVKALKVGATWCAPCRVLDKALPDIMKETPEIDWGKADYDESPHLMKAFCIVSVPMIIFFQNGKKFRRDVSGFGSGGTKALVREIKSIIA